MSGNSEPWTNTTLTGDNTIDGVLWGSHWSDGAINYSDPDSTDDYQAGYFTVPGEPNYSTGFAQLTANQLMVVHTALNQALYTQPAGATGLSVEAFTNLSITYAGAGTGVSTIRVANTSSAVVGTARVADFPDGSDHANGAGDVWFGGSGDNPTTGNYDYHTVIHELGHALGLKHGHSTTNLSGAGAPALPAATDSMEFSIMTYRSYVNGPTTGYTNETWGYAQTWMMYDIRALQEMYGADFTANGGDTVYKWSPTSGNTLINGAIAIQPGGNRVFATLWDGNGIDTYDLSDYTTGVTVDLTPGGWSVFSTTQLADLDAFSASSARVARGNIFNALQFNGDARSLIENAIGGSGSDTLTGNAANNTLTGNGDNDILNGGDGTGDTAVYFGARSQYATSLVSGAVRIVDQRPGAPDGTDDVSNVEYFRFSNGTYSLADVLNQPPVLSPDPVPSHPLTERAGLTNSVLLDTTSGTLSFTDEALDTHTASAVLFSATWPAGGAIPAGTQAALALAMTADSDPDDPAGSLEWEFKLTDSLVDFLAAGETLDAVYDLTLSDQLLNSATRQVTIRFTGTNDAPTVNAGASDFAGLITELAGVTGSALIDSDSGSVAFADVDLNDRPTASIGLQTVSWQDLSNDYTSELTAAQIAAFKAALSITPQGGNTNVGAIDWDYDIVDNLLDFLAVGETITVTSAIVIDDGNGGTVSPNVVVTLYGANDAPVAVPDSNGTAKSSTLTVAAAAGVLSNDSDPDVHDLDDLFVSQVNGAAGNVGTSVAGTYGALTLQANGSYVYTPAKGSLPSKIVAQDTFTYTVADGNGGTDEATLTILVLNPGVSYQAGKDTTLIGGNGQDVLDGSAGGNVMFGGNGADVLIGGDGNIMTGGNGPDIFLLRPDFGANTVTDFNVNTDALQFSPLIFSDAADVLAHTTEIGGNAVIDDGGGNTVTLVGVSLADLQSHTADFYFG